MTTAAVIDPDLEPVGQLSDRLKAILVDIRDEYLQPHSTPWILGFSGGKDSTLLAQLVCEMLLSLPPRKRLRAVHIVANDTLVESPVIVHHLDMVLERMRQSVGPLRLPIVVAKTVPHVEQTFWVNLIGRGYPSPSRVFRWCTDRMKIAPTTTYIKTQVDESGQAVLLLGVRSAESTQRRRSVSRYDNGQRLNPHNSLQNCLVYKPIVDLSTDEVWQTLLQSSPPWGGTHRELVTMYRNAGGGECPLVTDRSEAPSCGTASSRFGCWTCTVVEKDKSAESFIEAGYGDLEPLLEFRDWLKAIREDGSKRMAKRRNGTLNFVGEGRLIPGPFTLTARREIFSRLIAVQSEVNMELVSPAEIDAIRRIWAEDTIAMTKF
ncbi:DNA phosphorothioation system sulfurtransferase DndC [Mesorhizobium sp. M1A.F.Ca.ET.072.01.1.1]|uniref:DNA phosphorothioation system sulfurtransferase DndC n=1 Tax=Mesorhizobium sp. M1A.F.Ca.ET.072.01.1.1 TaxID=2496753 RepID=UPI000FD61AF3|nr:DNA phosphorothioation system sulfurtransferase DndC [Mesorhizobium sp. M1A.F.Ca.ET.072.01.1.1]RUW53356.1 DNA phosphorothioation system sulfurtransferase DndC [Mesorhizobium sp. M1A.F.Ca.ET.072.01.1.1]TIV04443.1 MAG: DNA phosphorothioation system sulfurtransferase DndC [Mesorhizobium sp.]